MNSHPNPPISLSFWSEKPWWCQPWTIILSGLFIIIASWISLHKPFITVALSLLVLIWWFMFLFLAPRAYLEYQNQLDPNE